MEPTNSGVFSEAAAQIAEPNIDPNSQGYQEQPQEQLVPLVALQAERRERQQLQDNLKLMQDHLSLLQANQIRPQQPEPDGLRDDDVLTFGDAKKYLHQTTSETKAEMMEMKTQHTYLDYSEVVRNYLPQALKEDPELLDEIKSAPNPYKFAYKQAKKSEAYQKAQREKLTSPEAIKAIVNSQRPGNLSSVGSVSPASQVGSYRNMSDGDFMKQVQKNLGYS